MGVKISFKNVYTLDYMIPLIGTYFKGKIEELDKDLCLKMSTAALFTTHILRGDLQSKDNSSHSLPQKWAFIEFLLKVGD